MIELPEAVTIARQMNETIKGRTIASCVRGNSPHKFAFNTGSPKEYARALRGKKVGGAKDRGPWIMLSIGSEHVLALGGGGERIRFHESDETLPKKYHLLLEFKDGTYMSVTVQGWGSVELLRRSEVGKHPYIGKKKVSPLSDRFTLEHFRKLTGGLADDDRTSVKLFMISEPGILGVGNGYLQDILLRAKIHPRRRVVDLSKREERALYSATRAVLKEATRLGGRDTERDLHDEPGGYARMLTSKSVGKPCPECGERIEKIQYLGGASYFCPSCQA